jgi:hypothetical protein
MCCATGKRGTPERTRDLRIQHYTLSASPCDCVGMFCFGEACRGCIQLIQGSGMPRVGSCPSCQTKVRDVRFRLVRVRHRLRARRFVSRGSKFVCSSCVSGSVGPTVLLCLCVSCVSRVMRVAWQACQHCCVSCMSHVARVQILRGCGMSMSKSFVVAVCVGFRHTAHDVP